MDADPTRLTVLGAGSWGTALACLLARNGHAVRLWARDPELVNAIRTGGQNPRYLPGVDLPAGISASADFADSLADAQAVVAAVPTAAFRSTLRSVAAAAPQCPVIWACKGLEAGSGKFMHALADEELSAGTSRALISGPNFAAEVARGLPAATSIASPQLPFANQVAGWFHGDYMRAYPNDDVVGVELGGAVKNVLAIAAGISDGLGFGVNSRAALITRGLAEIMRLGEALGARRETLMGLSGMGDLVLTCTDNQSRNRRYGLLLAEAYGSEAALAEIGQAVEGVNTAREVCKLAAAHDVEMPIAEQVYRVIHEDLAPIEAVRALLSRDLKPE